MGACTLMTVLYSFFPSVEGLSSAHMISEATSGSSVQCTFNFFITFFVDVIKHLIEHGHFRNGRKKQSSDTV